MKRFYKDAAVEKSGDFYAIALDGKPVKTPLRHGLQTLSQNLARAIADEWAAQVDIIKPSDMPLTQILSTRIDRVAAERPAMTETLMKYFDTDLVCYRTDFPPVLAARQADLWDPFCENFKTAFGAALETTVLLKALKQAPAAHEKIRGFITALDDDRFTILQLVAGITGSIVMALGFLRGEADAKTLYAAMRAEEDYKADLYNEKTHGPDPAQEKKDRQIMHDLKAAERYLALISNRV